MSSNKPTPQAVQRAMAQILDEQLNRQYLPPMPEIAPHSLAEESQETGNVAQERHRSIQSEQNA